MAPGTGTTGNQPDPVALGTDQQVVHQGPVWKLTSGADPDQHESWVERSMWLTAGGGLFHDGTNSDGVGEPCGCQVAGLQVKPVENSVAERFAFEIRAPGVGQGNAGATMVLAVVTLQERDAWLGQLAAFEGLEGQRSNLNPLDIYRSKGPRRKGSISEVELPPEGLEDLCPAVQHMGSLTEEEKDDSPRDTGEADSHSSFASEEEDTVSAMPSITPALSPTREQTVRRNSQSFYAEKLHTSLLLDWDDTIFPTTWVRRDCGMNWRLSLESQLRPGPRLSLISSLLEKLVLRALEFFEEASRCANIFIVTLSRRPWVEVSLQNFLPGLAAVIKQMGVKVIYAQEYVDERMAQQYSQDTFKSSEDSKKFWTMVKGEAIARELDELHQRNDTSWKNILSFGDSDFERYGTISAGEGYMERELKGSKVLRTDMTPDGATHTCEGVSTDGHLRKLRLKTVKMLGEPTIEELTAELALLKSWLPHMVQKDAGFDIELDSTDDNERLRDLHRQVTGEESDLTWERLAGMTEQPCG